MMRVRINVSKNTLSPAASRLRNALDPHQLAVVAARSGAALYVSQFEKLAAERHRGLSAAPHNFYATAARMTNGTASGNIATIQVDGPAGIRQRYLGGEIRAVNYPYLFIPLSGTPAEGRTAGDFTGTLVVIWNALTKKGVAKQRGKDGLVLFALRESITQSPDDTVLPSSDALSGAIRSAIAKRLHRAWKQDQSTLET